MDWAAAFNLLSLPLAPSPSRPPAHFSKIARTMARLRSKRDTGAAGPRKRTTGKSKPAASAVKSTATKPITLEGFFTLPYELKMVVIKLACSPTSAPASDPAAANPTRSWRQVRPSPGYMRPRLDFKTTLSLLCSSKGFYALVAPHLYSSVLISRPSALTSLSLALSSQPRLGSLIKSLYVGPIDPLPDGYWPIVVEDRSDFSTPLPPIEFIRSSLRGEGAKYLLRWSTRENQWIRDCGYERSSKAVCETVAAAEHTIDVDLDRNNRSKAGKELADVEYTKRVFELQAALDHFLMATRRGAEGRQMSSTDMSDDEDLPHHPTLVLTGYSESPRFAEQSDDGEEACVVDRSQLLRHLARPHALTDRFDHPLVFARSGLDTSTRCCTWVIEPTRRQRTEGSGAEDWARFFPSSPSTPDFSLRDGPSLHSLLDLLRSVLVQAHDLSSLSLAGFLNLAICGGQATILSLNHLRSLSMGPLPQKWFQPMELHRFAGVEELRLCGVRLHDAELDDVIAMFPNLRRLRWTMASRWRSEHSPG